MIGAQHLCSANKKTNEKEHLIKRKSNQTSVL